MSIGERLRKARKRRGLNQEQLAEKCGLKQSSISEIETGETKMPDGMTTVSVCEVLRIRPAWLIKNKEPMQPVEDPLPADAYELAQNWLQLSDKMKASTAAMIEEAAKGVPLPAGKQKAPGHRPLLESGESGNNSRKKRRV